MRHVPVIATIRDAYVFTATHLGGIIGLIWVPMVLATVMGFFSFQRYYTDFSDALASNNLAALAPSLLMMLCYLVAALLLQAIMYVAVVQMALGARAAPAIAHFAFGTLEWRMFRAFIAFIGICLMLVVPVLVDWGRGPEGGRHAGGPHANGILCFMPSSRWPCRASSRCCRRSWWARTRRASPRLDAVGRKFLAAAGGAGGHFRADLHPVQRA